MRQAKNDKIVFIIPGFRHKPTNKGYRALTRLFKNEGYVSIPVAIPWKQTTIVQNTEHFLKTYKKKVLQLHGSQKKIYLLGFSFGAMIAFLASTKIPVKGLILCSLSPFFKEDLPRRLPKKISPLQKERYESFGQLHSATLAKKVKAKKVMMLYGAKESRTVIHRMNGAFKHISSPEKYLFSIHKTEHNIADKNYLYAIHQVTQKLL